MLFEMEGGKVNVVTIEEMYRMKYFFEDAKTIVEGQGFTFHMRGRR